MFASSPLTMTPMSSRICCSDNLKEYAGYKIYCNMSLHSFNLYLLVQQIFLDNAQSALQRIMLQNELAKEVESGKKEKKNHCFMLNTTIRNSVFLDQGTLSTSKHITKII